MPAGSTVLKFRRIQLLILALALSPALGISPLASAQEPWPASRRGDLGVRYWLSTGETKISHNAQGLDPRLGNPTSVLVYGNLDAHVLEVFGRENFRNNVFLKAAVGVGRINRGFFDDEDYLAGQVKFSDTTSSMRDGRIGYGMIDLGHQWVLREGAISLGVFGGFSQWTEEYDAFGATATVGPINIDHSVNVITNKVRWRALRVGFAGQFVFGRARVGLDLAAVPYAKFYNEDSHHLRGDLGPVPNIIDSGEGYGVQADAELRYEIARRTELGIGLRYWHLEARDGTSDFRNIPGGETPIVEFYSVRSGVTLSLRRTW